MRRRRLERRSPRTNPLEATQDCKGWLRVFVFENAHHSHSAVEAIRDFNEKNKLVASNQDCLSQRFKPWHALHFTEMHHLVIATWNTAVNGMQTTASLESRAEPRAFKKCGHPIARALT